MSIPSFRRLSLLLLLFLALTVPRVTAAGQSRDVRQPVASQAAPADLLGHLWSFLANIWLKSGCYIDPSGRCTPQTATPVRQGDEGCYIDPDGRCATHLAAPPASTSQPKSGCYIDPNGGCTPRTATLDEGCYIDPNGRCLH
ncbi:MAG TPA: hypothetical protein VH988_02435 [Thermoanaerobaculia bacterium]|jgi:hypothetical protein|nr:hypothetical protein [Thermoanaerobaculia bacterium]